MPCRIKLTKGTFLTVVSIYASTRLHSDETLAQFYDFLSALLGKGRISNKLIILEDFNARLENDYALMAYFMPA